MAMPAAASATITIGSNLGREPDVGTSCNPSCTQVQASLSSALSAPGGVVSPVNGTVVMWRVRTGVTNTSPSALQVVRVLANGTAVATATSATVTPPVSVIQPYAAQLPIGVGESIGISCCLNTSSKIFVNEPGAAQRNSYLPALVNGGSPQPQFIGSPSPYETAINADIEPTATLSSVKAKPKRGGKIKVTMVVPNPGTLFASGKGLHSSPRQQVPAAGPFSLIVKPYFVTKRKLAAGKTVKRKLKLTFTPTGGSAAVQALKVKLKP
jgi:hypothetical protein